MPPTKVAAPSGTARSIIARFMHLLSAQGAEAIASTAFFLYLARLDSTIYGEVMYALAAGSIVMKIVHFGLYYPLVSDLGSASKEATPEILNHVNIIKLILLAPTMLFVIGTIFYRDFSSQMGFILFFMCLGFALDAIADTYFAEFRVRGRQDREGRIKIISSVVSYGYGFIAAALGMHPVLISLFKLISASVRTIFGIVDYLQSYSGPLVSVPDWRRVWRIFKAALVFALIEILGIIYNKTNIFFLEEATGVKGVAFYSATWNIVDPISVLASEQLLGWVIFPLLATLWWTDREQVKSLVRNNAQWLLALALPIMFVLHSESDLLIGLIYTEEYKDAAWMQQYLVWTILLSFENNLFAYVMMVAGAANMLLKFAIAATALNLVFNMVLVKPFGLVGGCLVIILTKLIMTIFTFFYCQLRFKFFKIGDFFFPVILAGFSYGIFLAILPLISLHPAVIITTGFYSLILWRLGSRFLGSLPMKGK